MCDNTEVIDLMLFRARQGDRQAFDSLVGSHYDRVKRFARRLCNDGELSDDIVADTFYRALRSLNTFHGDSSLSTWLQRIAFNVWFDQRKQVARRREQYLNDDVIAKQPWGHEVKRGDPLNNVTSELKRERLMQAIDQLPPLHQRMVRLYYIEQVSYRDIADQCRLPIGTVKSRMNRARISLSQILDRDIDFLVE